MKTSMDLKAIQKSALEYEGFILVSQNPKLMKPSVPRFTLSSRFGSTLDSPSMVPG